MMELFEDNILSLLKALRIRFVTIPNKVLLTNIYIKITKKEKKETNKGRWWKGRATIISQEVRGGE